MSILAQRLQKPAVSSVVLISFPGVEEEEEKERLVYTICTCAELEVCTNMMVNDSRE